MSLRASVLTPLLERVLKRPVKLDPDIPFSAWIGRMGTVAMGLLSGLLLTRRRVVLERGARIQDRRHFHTGGGFVRLGTHSRIECISRDGVTVGRNFKLGAFSRIVASGTLSDLGIGVTIGDNVGISEFAYIGGAGGVRIGSDVIVGQYFSTHPENHIFKDPTRLIRTQAVTRAGIKIGSDCWIGAKVTVLDGVTIGQGCVVAAGSVVTNSFPDNAVIGGVPARLLRMREP